MAFVQLSKISLAFGNRDILQNITLVLTDGTKAALTGANGSGKSTLMKIIAGISPADSGDISKEKNTRIAYLPQSIIVHSGRTLTEEVELAFHFEANLLEQRDLIGNQMESEKDEKKVERLVHEYHEIQTKIEASGWERRKGLIDGTLRGLGFKGKDFNRSVDEFSGGWQMRIALAKILLSTADILILDEPTNYLDIEARTWLEAWLKNFKGGFLLVSHDRSFLDACVQETYELFNGVLKKYPGTYTHYEKVREVELETLIKAFEQQQEEISRTEDFIRKFRYNKSKAAIVQDRIRRLEKLEPIEIPEHLKKIRFSFSPAPHSGKIILQGEGISKAYGERKILENLDLLIEKNERITLAGRNGAGKTTLLRILAHEDSSFSGTLSLGAGVQMGYFSQDESERITGALSIIELLEKEAPTELIPKLYDMLAAFLFRGDDIHKALSVLSGGEKSRLALLRLLLRPLNLLILDEPTNHLDLHSKDVLLDALKRFDGTVIFVSHDKGFIQGLATRVIELQTPENEDINQASRIRNYPGTYDYYLYRIGQEEKEAQHKGASLEPEKETSQKKGGATSYEKQKKLKAEKRSLEKEEARLLRAIEEAEEEKEKKEELLAKPEIYSDGLKCKEIQEKIKQVEKTIIELSAKWEKTTALLMEF